MDVPGHSLSTPLISNQGQFDLAERWILRLEVLSPPFPRALPRGVCHTVGLHGRNSVGVFTCWRANADTVSAATEFHLAEKRVLIHQARPTLPHLCSGLRHKQKQRAAGTRTRRVPFSRHLSLFSMFSTLNNKLLVV